MPEDAAAAELTLGEIHTGLLQNSVAITAGTARELLSFGPPGLVRTWERPVRHAVSPVQLVGVDALMPTGNGRDVRGVGTVASDAGVTGGRVHQVTATARLVPAAESRRLPWSHYLARPGVIETHRAIRVHAAADAFFHQDRPRDVLDLGGICTSLLDAVRERRVLDGAAPFRVPLTRLRWAAITNPDPAAAATVHTTLEPGAAGTLRITAPAHVTGLLLDLCRDVALHDWLLTTVLALVDRAGIGERSRADVLDRLSPAVDHLLHLWMPASRLPDALQPYWAEIEHRSGLSRQWRSTVHRIRDQLALAATGLG